MGDTLTWTRTSSDGRTRKKVAHRSPAQTCRSWYGRLPRRFVCPSIRFSNARSAAGWARAWYRWRTSRRRTDKARRDSLAKLDDLLNEVPGIPSNAFYSWPALKRLDLLANACRHSDGDSAVWLFDQQLDRLIGGARTDFRRAARWPLRAQPKSLYLRDPGGKRGAPGDRSSHTRPPHCAFARSDAAVTQAVEVR